MNPIRAVLAAYHRFQAGRYLKQKVTLEAIGERSDQPRFGSTARMHTALEVYLLRKIRLHHIKWMMNEQRVQIGFGSKEEIEKVTPGEVWARNICKHMTDFEHRGQRTQVNVQFNGNVHGLKDIKDVIGEPQHMR